MKKIIITKKQLAKFDGNIEWAVADLVADYLNEKQLSEYADGKMTGDTVTILNSNGEVVTEIKYEIEGELKMTNKEIMTKAVELAKKMEGDWIARMKLALKTIWAIAKKVNNKVEKFVTELGYGRKYWIAKVTGTHPQYKVDRQFLNENYTEDGQRVFELVDGLYHGKFSNSPHYFLVENGEAQRVGYDEVLEMAAAM